MNEESVGIEQAPEPSAEPPPDPGGQRRRDLAALMAAAGTMVMVGALLRWYRFTAGPFAFHNKVGVRAGTPLVALLTGALLVFNGIRIIRGHTPDEARRPAASAVLSSFLGIMFLVVYLLMLDEHVAKVATATAGALVAKGGPSAGAMSSAIDQAVGSGQLHVSALPGFYITLAAMVIGGFAAGRISRALRPAPAARRPLRRRSRRPAE